MGSESQITDNVFIRTALMHSKPLSDIAGREIYLKLENTQPSGSFKLRGLSNLCKEKLKKGCTRFIGTSGGNAGLALTYAAQELGVPCDVFVPEFVPPRMLQKLRSYKGTKVTIIGRDWFEANQAAVEFVKNNPHVAYIHPFDDPAIWEGHATMIQEIKEDLKGRKPSCVVVSVGGGGLAMGVLQGLESVGWEDVPLLCMETVGAECFHLSVEKGEIVVLDRLTSIAKTLGARATIPELLEATKKFNIITHVLPDKDAANGCIRLADDHGFLVEPSCGVTMASVYSKVIPDTLEKRGIRTDNGPIVLIVCGGSDISHEILQDFGNMFEISLKD